LQPVYAEMIGKGIEIHLWCGWTGHNSKIDWPMDWQFDWHIQASIWCKFEAYLFQNNWQKKLNTAMEWADRQK
jgi:hypothetical protein